MNDRVDVPDGYDPWRGIGWSIGGWLNMAVYHWGTSQWAGFLWIAVVCFVFTFLSLWRRPK